MERVLWASCRLGQMFKAGSKEMGLEYARTLRCAHKNVVKVFGSCMCHPSCLGCVAWVLPFFLCLPFASELSPDLGE